MLALVRASLSVAVILTCITTSGSHASAQPAADAKTPWWKKGEAEKKAAADKEAADKAAAEKSAEQEKAKAAADEKAKADEDAKAKKKKDDDAKKKKPVEEDDDDDGGGSDSIAFKAGVEISGYKDDDATNVLTPGITVGVEDEVAGWGVDAAFLVDVVTAASVDIVATSSPRWTDVRYVPALSGHIKVGDIVTLSAGGGASIESDYAAGSGTVGIALELANKTITPSLSYTFGMDVAGRAGTPYSVYSKDLMRHAAQLGVTFVVNKSTIFVPTFTAAFEIGDAAKPYRYLPTFVEGTPLEPGASIDEVNQKRTDVRLEERVPDARYRFAGAALIATRAGPLTFRLEERLYGDTWFLLATTTDILVPIDIGDAFRLIPHARFHAQKGVSFWELGYTAALNPTSVTVPGLRAGDRELGPMLMGSLGLGIRVGSEDVGFTIGGDAIYTRFLDHLYITDRWAGFGVTTFDFKIQ